MPHPLVRQLRFTRSEFKRALAGLTDSDARRRFLPMNCISWNIGHMAWQEQRYWLWRAQGIIPLPHVNALFAYGPPANRPSLKRGRRGSPSSSSRRPQRPIRLTIMMRRATRSSGKPPSRRSWTPARLSHLSKISSIPSYLQAGPSFFIEKSKRRMIAEDIAAALRLLA